MISRLNIKNFIKLFFEWMQKFMMSKKVNTTEFNIVKYSTLKLQIF